MELLSLQDCWVSRVTAFNACSALVLQAWDWLVCIDEEISWIWPQRRSAMYKWLYLLCRYAAFGFQLFNILFVRRMEQHVQFELSSCRLWLIYQGVVVEIFLAIVEGLLMVRVYGLWGRSRRIFALLALFSVVEASSSIATTIVATGGADFNQLCLFKKPPLPFVLFSVAALIMQLGIISLTVYKQCPFSNPRRPDLVTFVTREGNVVSLTISALVTAGIVYLLLDTEYGDIMYYWIVSILSVCGCRLVLSVHRFSSANDEEPPADEILFTSVCVIEQELEAT